LRLQDRAVLSFAGLLRQVGGGALASPLGQWRLVAHRRVGVDRLLAGPASPATALDAPSQEVEPLVDVADPRLGLRQAQAHRGQHRRHLIPERFGVAAGAGDHDHEVVRVADQPHDRATSAAMLDTPPLRSERFPLAGEALVQHGQGDVGQQW
jgi:hypothetical protein